MNVKKILVTALIAFLVVGCGGGGGGGTSTVTPVPGVNAPTVSETVSTDEEASLNTSIPKSSQTSDIVNVNRSTYLNQLRIFGYSNLDTASLTVTGPNSFSYTDNEIVNSGYELDETKLQNLADGRYTITVVGQFKGADVDSRTYTVDIDGLAIVGGLAMLTPATFPEDEVALADAPTFDAGYGSRAIDGEMGVFKFISTSSGDVYTARGYWLFDGSGYVLEDGLAFPAGDYTVYRNEAKKQPDEGYAADASQDERVIAERGYVMVDSDTASAVFNTLSESGYTINFAAEKDSLDYFVTGTSGYSLGCYTVSGEDCAVSLDTSTPGFYQVAATIYNDEEARNINAYTTIRRVEEGNPVINLTGSTEFSTGTPTISAITAAGATVNYTVSRSGVDLFSGTETADSAGVIQFSPGSPLTDGLYDITFEVSTTDGGYTVSDAGYITFTIAI